MQKLHFSITSSLFHVVAAVVHYFWFEHFHVYLKCGRAFCATHFSHFSLPAIFPKTEHFNFQFSISITVALWFTNKYRAIVYTHVMMQLISFIYNNCVLFWDIHFNSVWHLRYFLAIGLDVRCNQVMHSVCPFLVCSIVFGYLKKSHHITQIIF